jgi:hypothetical protein
MDWIGLFGWKGGGWCDGEAGGFVFESGVVIFFDSIVHSGPLHGRASWRFGIAVRDSMSHITLNIIGGVEIRIYWLMRSPARDGRACVV